MYIGYQGKTKLEKKALLEGRTPFYFSVEEIERRDLQSSLVAHIKDECFALSNRFSTAEWLELGEENLHKFRDSLKAVIDQLFKFDVAVGDVLEVTSAYCQTFSSIENSSRRGHLKCGTSLKVIGVEVWRNGTALHVETKLHGKDDTCYVMRSDVGKIRER